MSTIINLCLLCLTKNSNTNFNSILSIDSDGEIVKEKLKCFLSKQIKIEPEDSVLYICLPCLEKLNNVYNYKRLCVWNINRFNSFLQKLKSTDETHRNVQVTLIDININEETCGKELNSDSKTRKICKVDNPNESGTKHRQKPEVVGETLAKESNEMRYVNMSDNIENNKAHERNLIQEDVLKILDDEIKYEFVGAIVKEETEDNYDVIDEKSELYNNDAFLNGTDNINIKEETCGKKLNSDSITIVNSKIDNATVHKDPNEDEFKNRQKPESVGEILAQGSNDMRNINISNHIENNKSQEENVNKDEDVAKNLDDEMKFEFVGVTVKEEPEDNYDAIVDNSESYNDAFSNSTDNHEESTTYISPVSADKSSKCGTHLTLCHTGEKPFKCDICDKAFSLKTNLTRHKRCHTHTGEKPYKCDTCDKTFNYSSNLVKHKRCHTGEKPFQCDVCGKTFSEKVTLVRHKYSHTGEKPYKCDICNKTFSVNCTLVKHKLIHTGEKPFKCDVCDKMFSQKVSLVRHKYSHIGEKPCKCDICNKTFSFNSDLVKHTRFHTGEKPYKCDICDKTFSNRSNFVEHKRRHTGDKPRQNI